MHEFIYKSRILFISCHSDEGCDIQSKIKCCLYYYYLFYYILLINYISICFQVVAVSCSLYLPTTNGSTSAEQGIVYIYIYIYIHTYIHIYGTNFIW